MNNFDEFKTKNVVSVWAGKFLSEEDFLEFIDFKYDADGNSSNLFCKEAGLSGFDRDLQEAVFLKKDQNLSTALQNISGISYFSKELTSVLARFPKHFFNSIFLLYEFQYKPGITRADYNSRLKFIGSFEYQPN